jgi:predicted transcriptional regulator
VLFCGVLVSVFSFSAFLPACVKKSDRAKGELRSITVRGKPDASLELVLLKSFGISSEILKINYSVSGASASADGGVFGFSGLSVELKSPDPQTVRNLLPLYAQSAASRVNFQSNAGIFSVSDLMSPAVQAVIGRELKLNQSGLNFSSAEALLSVLLSDSAQLRFVSHDKSNISNLFGDGLSFKSVGEIPDFSKPVAADKRERNSGFAVGDMLIISDKSSPSELLHAAVWVDHDVYFEVLPMAQSLVFRFASYAQLMQELSSRLRTDVRLLKMLIVRKNVSWSEVAGRVRQFRDQKIAGTGQLISDPAGRARASALEGLTLTTLLPRENSDER